MGITEEGGKVAGGIIDALKQQPLTLALVIFNMIFLYLVYAGTGQQRALNEKIITSMVENQHKTAELLFKCAPTQQQRMLLPYKDTTLPLIPQ